jgi:DNA recombination protein RmuC
MQLNLPADPLIGLFGLLLAGLAAFLIFLLVRLSRRLGRLEEAVREGAAENRREARENRTEAAAESQRLRAEIAAGQKSHLDTVIRTLSELGRLQAENLAAVEKRIKLLTEANDARLEKLRETLEQQLRELQESNQKKLDEMRRTVDEKLQSTLEKRLGESFRLVSERLEAVQRGLGEMQSLASGVGDLKRMLTNVKTRGTWGEVQLGEILDQVLTPDQYARNVQTRAGSAAVVEYAIRLPGREEDSPVWLPVDAKFPQEDYQRLLEAAEAADSEAVAKAAAALARAVEKAAGEIAEKYLDPPRTTDFAILFLPTEGLYAEVLRQPGMVEKLQRRYRIVAAGPTTLAALLNSLRMGFRTLAIEKRSSEVWQILAAVKSEFSRFEEILAKVKKQLETAAGTLEKTGVRTRAMERKLRQVEELPATAAARLLELDDGPPDSDSEEESEKP